MVRIEKVSGGCFISVTWSEGLALIKSLAEQMLTKSSNVGRVEFSEPYFSIAVDVMRINDLDDVSRYRKAFIGLNSKVERVGKEWVLNGVKGNY